MSRRLSRRRKFNDRDIRERICSKHVQFRDLISDLIFRRKSLETIPRVFACLYRRRRAAIRELIVRHPPEPTTTLSRNMDYEQGVEVTIST